MTGKNNFTELHLYEIWKKQLFSSPLKTHAGENVVVLNAGELNHDRGGPDFRNARIRVGNLTFVGDIEIDRDYSDWKIHKHNINENYNSVVLHLTYSNRFSQEYVYNADGRKIPSISLNKFISKTVLEDVKQNIESEKKNIISLRCSSRTRYVDDKIKKDTVKEFGEYRFQKKVSRIKERLKELAFLSELKISEPVINYDLPPEFYEREFNKNDFKNREIWEQLFYEFLFEALGYTNNKKIMLNLARTVDVKFLKNNLTKDDPVEKIESILFNVSGLYPQINDLPEEEYSDYTIKLNDYWENIKKKFDSRFYNETDWQFFKLRPHNFPTIRIAGGARLLQKILFDEFISKFINWVDVETKFNKLLIDIRTAFIVKSEGYWQTHYIFDKEAPTKINLFVGASRGDEIVVNVLLPFLQVYFEVFENKSKINKVLNAYYLFTQKGRNKIVNDVASALNLTKEIPRSIFAQGMIELYRNHCSKNKCKQCKIGKEIFS